MKNVIIRNMERLLDNETAEREPIEPMTDWKWNELYKLTTAFHLTPWIAEVGPMQMISLCRCQRHCNNSS